MTGQHLLRGWGWRREPRTRSLGTWAPASAMLLTRSVTSGKSRPLSGPQFRICQATVARADVDGPPGAVTAPLPPRKAVLGESQLRAPPGPPLPAPRPPAPHPEPLLLVRLDLGVQLPQRVREAAEEQVLADQLVCALHCLRHLCASAVRDRGGPGREGRGLGRAGRGRARSPITSRRGRPTSPHAPLAARLWTRPGPAPRHHHPAPRANERSTARRGFLAALAAALSSELLKVAAAVQVK